MEYAAEEILMNVRANMSSFSKDFRVSSGGSGVIEGAVYPTFVAAKNRLVP